MSVSQFNGTPAGLEALNDFLLTRSFLEGFSPSQTDTFVFKKLTGDFDADKYPNVVRWYRQIGSYGADIEGFPGDAPEGKEAAPAKSAAASKGDDSDSDSDSSDDSDFEIPESSDDDDDINLTDIQREQKAAQAAKEAAKLAKAKSMIIFDVKPFEAETKAMQMDAKVRKIEMEGLTWGTGTAEKVAFGVEKLQIAAVVLDQKVSVDVLEEKIMELDDGDLVQSIDIVSFNKL